MVIACLDELGRGDIVEVIREEEEEKESPQVDGNVNDEDGTVTSYKYQHPFLKVFISYQWDHQEEAIRVRQFLEEVRHLYWQKTNRQTDRHWTT